MVATDEKVEPPLRQVTPERQPAIQAKITDKDRIKEILPDISTDNILGAGCHRMTDTLDADGTMISNTYARRCRKTAVIKTGVKVTKF